MDPGEYAWARAQPDRQRTRKNPNRRFDQESQQGERNSESKYRKRWMLRRWRDELGQEREVKNGHFGIGQIGNCAIQKELTQGANRVRSNGNGTAPGSQQTDPKVKQVPCADKFERNEQPFGCAQNRAQPERHQNG